MKKQVVIVGMARTPIGNFQGGLSPLSAVELGVAAGGAALQRAGVRAAEIDEVVTGMVYKAGAKGNPARQIQIALGIPVEGGALTVDQQCASGMRALEIACQQILLGKTQAALVCGIESMSNVPYLDLKRRKGQRMGDATLADGLLHDALHDAFSNRHMGLTAETLAETYGITRSQQDEYALLSYRRALEAAQEGRFQEEIVPVEVKTRKGTVTVDADERPKEISREELAAMRPSFRNDGTVTAGNASGINDGACALVVMSPERAAELGVRPLAKILSTATVGVDPAVMGIGPVYVIPEAIRQAGLSPGDISYYEINEAFAAQLLACTKELQMDVKDLNVNGSGISLGHPVGCTGLRVIQAAYQELKRRGAAYGCASLCAGGGPAMAVVIERWGGAEA